MLGVKMMMAFVYDDNCERIVVCWLSTLFIAEWNRWLSEGNLDVKN